MEATRLIMQNLPRVVKDGQDLEARQNMALASYKAGVAFTTAGVGYVHAIAHNFGAYYHVPHGLANAIILPRVLDFSKAFCIERLAYLAQISGLRKGQRLPTRRCPKRTGLTPCRATWTRLSAAASSGRCCRLKAEAAGPKATGSVCKGCPIV